MAVVIQGDRLIAARVQLPLAELGAVEDGNLGSRHRAAIGISAGTDATVIVVSEETGIISLAVNGTLIRAIPEEQLRNHLTAGLLEKAAIIQTLRDQENQLAETSDEKKNS